MNPGLSYREAAVAGATPIRLVILLYEQAIEDLGRALSAHRQGKIEERTREINHAVLVLGHLQSTLDKDRGGRVAANLDLFYTQVRAGLVKAQFKQSADAIQQQISCLMHVHETWCEIEKTIKPTLPPPEDKDAIHSSSEWNA